MSDTNKMYQYRIKSTGHSSHKYGKCEVCGEHVSEVFHQVESREYKKGRHTYYNCHNLYGCKECLLSKRQ